MTVSRTILRRAVAMAVVAIAVLLLLIVVGSSAARATTHEISAQVAQQSPYQPPDVTGGDAPGWLAPFSFIARLPLWAQAAVLSAVAAAAFFVVPTVVRWVWRFVSNLNSRTTG